MPDSYLNRLIDSPFEPFVYFVDPARRVYWMFLVSAVLLGVFVYRLANQSGGLIAYLWPRRVWLHRSAVVDYQLLFAKSVVSALLFAPVLLTSSLVAAVVVALLHTAAPREAWGAPWWAIAWPFSFCAFVAEDLCRYIVHRAMHRFPALWELHKVHHSAEVLTPFTLYRIHPIESFLNASASALAVGVVTGCFFYLYAGKLVGLQILGVDAAGFLFGFLGANLRHTHVWLSYGPRIERWLISPAQHQCHHSLSERHQNKNYGSVLALWDRWGKSLYIPDGKEELTFGLRSGERNHEQGLLSALFRPIGAAGRAVFRRGSVS